jgi:predicted nucleotidyltransferase
LEPALDSRRRYSLDRQKVLESALSDAAEIARGKACVYVTGSFGRGEACSHSDLDLFIVGQTDPATDRRLLTNLDEICLKAELIRAVREHGFPEFSGDGEYLEHYTVGQLVKSLGTPEDDAENTFTARLLLLLESKSLIGEGIYRRVIGDVVAAYWRDYTTHTQDFLPAFMTNDVLRLWRTFCVNYEARTSSEPDVKRRKRRLKNYKLKHSRLLTCYSALLYLMTIWGRKKTVSPEDAIAMVELTPTERLERIRTFPEVAQSIPALDRVRDRYAEFLKESDASESDLLERVGDADKRREMFKSAEDFGDAVFQAISEIGAQSAFHRTLVV